MNRQMTLGEIHETFEGLYPGEDCDLTPTEFIPAESEHFDSRAENALRQAYLYAIESKDSEAAMRYYTMLKDPV